MKTKLFVAVIAAFTLTFVGCKQVKDNMPIVDPTSDFPEAVGFDKEGAMPGVFSVGENKTIQFSRGNLQYLSVTNTWRFANSQLAYVGGDNAKVGAENATWMDLYAFGTSSWYTEVTQNDYKLHLDTLRETTITSHDTLIVRCDTIMNSMAFDTIWIYKTDTLNKGTDSVKYITDTLIGKVDTTFYTKYVTDTIQTVVSDTSYKDIRIDTLDAYYDVRIIKSTNYMPYSLASARHYKSLHVDTLDADRNLPYFDYLCKTGVYVGNDSIIDISDLQGDFAQADWGVHNSISNGGNKPNIWRLLSAEELDYILFKRDNAKNLAGIAAVADVCGLVILPNNWDNVKPFNAGFEGGYRASNIISEADWQIFEQHGAIFLPCAGRRSQSTIFDVQKQGYYWTSTNGRMVVIFKDGVSIFETDKSNGAAIRLVKEVK